MFISGFDFLAPFYERVRFCQVQETVLIQIYRTIVLGRFLFYENIVIVYLEIA